MAFDMSRPVPWARLLKLLGIYLVGVNVVIYLLGRNDYTVATFASTLVGGVVYVALVVILVKFGWDPFRFTRKPARPSAPPAKPPTAPPVRSTPAPTKRTNAGNRKAKRR